MMFFVRSSVVEREPDSYSIEPSQRLRLSTLAQTSGTGSLGDYERSEISHELQAKMSI